MKFDTEEGTIHFSTSIANQLSVRMPQAVERKYGSAINEIANAYGGYLAQEVPLKNGTTSFIYYFKDGFSPRVTANQITEWIKSRA